MGSVDDYLETLDPASGDAVRRVLEIVRELVPDAEQGTAYGMAALRWHGKPLLGFRTASRHLSVFPFSPAAVDAARPELAGFDLSKGTVRFTAAQPLPDDAVRALVRYRAAEIHG